LVADPQVEIIYVSSPHSCHQDNASLCINAGKAVLCEKPITINCRQAEALIKLAREKNVFLMEAMWTRYLPLYVRLRELLNEGRIGEPRMLHATFGFRREFDPKHRLFNPELGGGALLDIGVYVVSLASMIFGEASTIGGHAHIGESGVDEQNAIILGYPKGQLASLTSSITAHTPQDASIVGTEGHIHIPGPFWKGQRMVVRMLDGSEETIECTTTGNGYNYEAVHAGECLRHGLLESPIMTLTESFSIMDTLDELRNQWRLFYPMEEV
jgi:predicted dehydrogenase